MVCNADATVPMPTGASPPPNYAEIVLEDKHLGKSVNGHHEPSLEKLEEGASTAHQQPHYKSKETISDERPAQSIWLLAYCFLGIMVSFSLNGIVLEKMTTHRVLGEMSLTFVFCLFYSVVALGLRFINKEKPSTMPQTKLMIVGLLAFGSTISSMIALRYVTFITRILGKSCKSIPVMLVGLFLGKSYTLKKYFSVVVLSIGVAIFLVGTAHEKQHRAAQSNEDHHHHGSEKPSSNIFLGFSLLVLSLLFDGATGALEDRFLEKYHIGAFDLMYVVNIWKSLFAAIGMVVMGELPTFVEKAVPSLPNLILLSATGALGQAFIFFTISKFGALTTSIIGTCRKVLSIVLSVILFGHVLSAEQFVGLLVAFVGIGLNWIRVKWCDQKPGKKQPSAEKDVEAEELLEASDETVDSDDEDGLLADTERSDLLSMKPREEVLHSKDLERGLELVNVWHRHHEHTPPAPADGHTAPAV